MNTESLIAFLSDWKDAIRAGKPMAVTLTQAMYLDEAITVIVMLQAELAVRERRKIPASPPPIGERRTANRRGERE